MKYIHKYWFFIIISFSIFLYFVSLTNRAPHLDDAWLGEHSYWLAKDGIVKSKLMTGFAGSEDRLLLHHKFFTIQGALFIYIFGFHLAILKTISFIYTILFGISFWVLVKKISIDFDSKTKILALWLIFYNPLMFEFSYVFRPDVMLMTLGFISFAFIFLSLKEDKILLYSSLAGVFAGLAVFAHLNGIIFAAAGFLVYLFRWKPKQLLFYSIVGFICSLGYFYDFRSFSDFGIWYDQLTFVPTAKADTLNPILQLVINIFGEHKRYFHSPHEIIFSVSTIFCLIINRKKLFENQSLLLQYLLFAVLSLAVFALNKTSKYLILLLPFFSIIIFQTLLDLTLIPETAINKINWKKNTLIGLLFIFTCIASIFNYKTSINKYDSKLNSSFTARFAPNNTNQTSVLAPMEFIYDEMGKYKSIVSLMSFSERMKIDTSLVGEGILRKTRLENIDILYFTEYYRNKFGMKEYPKGGTVENYLCVYADNEMTVWDGRKFEINDSISTNYDSGKPVRLAYRVGPFNYSSAFK